MIRIYTRMVADLFHPGHVAFLRGARELGDHLTVHVVPDELVEKRKGRPPIMTQAERAQLLMACRYVDAVFYEAPPETTPDFMRANHFDLFALACSTAEERSEKLSKIQSLPREIVCEIGYTHGISTSQIVRRVIERHELMGARPSL